MNVNLIEAKQKKKSSACILNNKAAKLNLPTVTDGWRFNFNKHSKKRNFQTFVLVCINTPEIIEGCLIFEMKNTIEPYMAYIEIAPHNKGENRRYENVAGCLIAFACRLSFKHGEGDYQGWLAFDVLEESKKDEEKLMVMYSVKYNALRLGNSQTMVIPPDGGEKLIKEFLSE